MVDRTPCPAVRQARWLAIALLVSAACTTETEQPATGVRLTIRYQEVPVSLRVTGATGDDRFFGPAALPDPPRLLAPEGETVFIAVPEQMDGSVLTLSVLGLDERRVAVMRGTVRTEIVRYAVQSAFVSLAKDARPIFGDAGVPEMADASTPAPDADATVAPPDRVVEPDADPVTDEEPKLIDSGAPLPPDAAISEPEPEPEPEPPVSLQCGATKETCDVKCPEDKQCAIACGGVEECKPACKNATCYVDCEDASRCRPACEAEADCEITCHEGEACAEISCKRPARCLLRCEGQSSDCDLRCAQESDRKVCPGGVIVCNRECP